MKEYYWTMKDGSKINVDDMTEEHLKNVLKLIIRREEGKRRQDILDTYCDATECDIY